MAQATGIDPQWLYSDSKLIDYPQDGDQHPPMVLLVGRAGAGRGRLGRESRRRRPPARV